MDIELFADRKLSLFMKDYIEESINFSERRYAKKGLQNIEKSSTRLENKDADILHSMVEKLLWVAKWGTPKIEPKISLLCTRVTNSIKEDTETLRRVLQYLKHTIDDKKIVGEYSLSQLCIWVDPEYKIHSHL